MHVVCVTKEGKIRIKNSSGEIIIDPIDVNTIIGSIKDVMQVSEFQCERDEYINKEGK